MRGLRASRLWCRLPNIRRTKFLWAARTNLIGGEGGWLSRPPARSAGSDVFSARDPPAARPRPWRGPTGEPTPVQRMLGALLAGFFFAALQAAQHPSRWVQPWPTRRVFDPPVPVRSDSEGTPWGRTGRALTGPPPPGPIPPSACCRCCGRSRCRVRHWTRAVTRLETYNVQP